MMKSKKIIFLSIAFLLILTLGLVLPSSVKKSGLYKKALDAEKNGDLNSAWLILKKLGSYKNADEKISSLEQNDFLIPLRVLEKGNAIDFGKFEQDGNFENGPESIKWIILDRIENEVLLLSESILDARPYNPVPFEEITWEKSGMRAYLNEDFFNAAFSEKEKSAIIQYENENADQSELGTEGGMNTLDKVFLLSETESVIYINDEISRNDIGKAFPSELAKSKGIDADEIGFSPWWLRSPGVYGYSAQFINSDGELYLSGAYVDIESSYGMRPAIWVDTNGDAEK